jgi:DNA-3-methyladenine glycosylase I
MFLKGGFEPPFLLIQMSLEPTKSRCSWAQASEELRKYHDEEYGMARALDVDYYEMLVLELFQAGLSWRTILAKRDNFRKAFKGFDFRVVSRFGDAQIRRLMADKGIVRNLRKIKAAVENARRFAKIIDGHGSFRNFLGKLPLDDRDATVRAFKREFVFMGPKIVEEFLMSTGHWPVNHEKSCFLYRG